MTMSDSLLECSCDYLISVIVILELCGDRSLNVLCAQIDSAY